VEGSQSLKPYSPFLTKETEEHYPDITADDHVMEEYNEVIKD